MVSPLNINLIIPFKDNKGDRLRLYLLEIQRFDDGIKERVEELKGEVADMCGEDFALTIAARSDGNAKRYYWRFKSSKADRKYNRLVAESVSGYVSSLDNQVRIWLKGVEEELIYLNANLKVIKGMRDAVEQSQVEQGQLYEATFCNRG